MNNIELIKKELGEDIFPIALSSVRRLMMLARRDELFRINKKMQEYVHASNLRGFQIWLNKECEKSQGDKNE